MSLLPTPLHRPQQRVGFRVEHVLIQTHELGLAEQQIKVLQRLTRPERFHLVQDSRARCTDVADGPVREWCATVIFNRSEHVPTRVLKASVPGYAVKDKD